MKEYKVISTDSKVFGLTISGKEIGILRYEKWFSFKAEIILADQTIYNFEPKGFWGTTVELKNGDAVLLNLKKHWMGKIIISTLFDEEERDFIFKPSGILGGSYVLTDMDMQELLVVQADLELRELKYNYIISTTDTFDNFNYNKTLLLTTIYCVNYYLATMVTMIG